MAPFTVRAARHLYLCHGEIPPLISAWAAGLQGGN
jgi:hypothetical protein